MNKLWTKLKKTNCAQNWKLWEKMYFLKRNILKRKIVNKIETKWLKKRLQNAYKVLKKFALNVKRCDQNWTNCAQRLSFGSEPRRRQYWPELSPVGAAGPRWQHTHSRKTLFLQINSRRISPFLGFSPYNFSLFLLVVDQSLPAWAFWIQLKTSEKPVRPDIWEPEVLVSGFISVSKHISHCSRDGLQLSGW